MGRFRFSLAVLFRAHTLVVFALAWLIAIRTTRPSVVMNALIILGVMLAMVVGWRRHARPAKRLGVAAGFFCGAALFALYLAYAATTFQLAGPHAPEQELAIFILVLASPAVATVLVVMLQTWTWSAHDREIHRQERV